MPAFRFQLFLVCLVVIWLSGSFGAQGAYRSKQSKQQFYDWFVMQLYKRLIWSAHRVSWKTWERDYIGNNDDSFVVQEENIELLLFLLILLMMSFNDQKESGFLKCHTPLFNVIVLRQKCKEKIFNLTCLHLYFGNIYMSLWIIVNDYNIAIARGENYDETQCH